VEAALKTINNQIYSNLEVIVVEDGSCTLEPLIAQYTQYPITYFYFKNRVGRCKNGNKGVELAKGKYANFLDEDDLLYADHVEQLVAGAEKNASSVVYSFGFELPSKADQEGEILKEGPLKAQYVNEFSFLKLIKGNLFPINTILFKRELFEEIGGFDPKIDYLEDWDLWLRMAIIAKPYTCIPRTTCLYRVPFEKDTYDSRHEILNKYHKIVRAKHDKLRVSFSIKELFADALPTNLEHILIDKFPRYASTIKLFAGVSRQFRALKYWIKK